ncbi:hypothetical protein PFAG_01396 [Plasmodium falciparum Santa Lucia]|uniref:Uncharacterized protein n=5 Tax=Plasmodium falciparum TaxID=5833 RepID=A0A024X255_PLAFC|nr:hypothetical protein PFFVO_01431 [Plasmodium falciparum Vietnam Oak-Knoll (FVO)]ETW43947.1 hypothetical protein PFNF135_01546 [Plasmodium falciparum NF135/5.C10]ETW58861.1 hypothetical protein PFMC_05254 [Plasmodium falciparum CAMP/Malaysia]EUR74995.1 hypothetical protein PFBG_01435 [Plasmodium falciparum 7G8]EUT89246.1 hypothetical protein PFAG_01396 [Plasmodium falciparum Santa Lucia]
MMREKKYSCIYKYEILNYVRNCLHSPNIHGLKFLLIEHERNIRRKRMCQRIYSYKHLCNL